MKVPPPDQSHASRQPAGRVPKGVTAYAVGDIHGRIDLLDALLEKIADDARDDASSRRVLIFLGDYIDRGIGTFQVVERLSRLTEKGGFKIFRQFDIHFLKGNHEDCLIKFIDAGDNADSWMSNGGRETLISYGVGISGIGGNLTRLRRDLRAAIPDRHLEFFRTLDLHHVEGDYFFVHAGIRPGVALDAQDPFDMMWIRRDFLSCQADFGKIIIHGHSPNFRPVIKSNRIGIDTAAYYSDRLTALVLQETKRRFLHT
jgi:serine/threonine protein phosphatase 1